MGIFKQIILENDLAKLKAAIKKMSAKNTQPNASGDKPTQTKKSQTRSFKVNPEKKPAAQNTRGIDNPNIEAVRKGTAQLNKTIDAALKGNDSLQAHIDIMSAVQDAGRKLAQGNPKQARMLELEITDAAFGYMNKKYMGGDDSNYRLANTRDFVNQIMKKTGSAGTTPGPDDGTRVRADFSWDNDMTDKSRLKEAASMNISMSGDNAGEVAGLLNILKNAGMAGEPHVAMQSTPMRHDIERLRAIVDEPDEEESSCGCGGDTYENQPNEEYEELDELLTMGTDLHAVKEPQDIRVKDSSAFEDYENEPEEEYGTEHYMTQDLAGGINKKKKMYKASQRGDNAMAVESFKDTLHDRLAKKLK